MKFESLQRYVIKPDYGLLLLRAGLGSIMTAHGVMAILDGKGKQHAWEIMSRGRFFNEDFLEEIDSLKEGAMRFRQQLEEQGLQL